MTAGFKCIVLVSNRNVFHDKHVVLQTLWKNKSRAIVMLKSLNTAGSLKSPGLAQR